MCPHTHVHTTGWTHSAVYNRFYDNLRQNIHVLFGQGPEHQ